MNRTRPNRPNRPAILAALLTVLTASTAGAEDSGAIEIRDALALPGVSRGGRSPVHVDPIEAQIVAGDWSMPHPGDEVTLPDGQSRTWQAVSANEDGWFQGRELRGSYVAVEVESESDRVMILEAAGHSMVTVDGVPRTGDPYGLGWLRLPIALKAGRTPLLFSVGRGRLRARLVEPEQPLELEPSDPTLPDLVAGEPVETVAAVLVRNASQTSAADLMIEASLGAVGETPGEITAVPPLLPLSVRKVGFAIRSADAIDHGAESVPLVVRLIEGTGENRRVLDELRLDLGVRTPEQSRKQTFISGIDGSVQYYGLQPMTPGEGEADRPPALFLSLHGASVEAIGQANAYAPKSWGHVVAPTNRRPYGFDWEDWGRLDALEVLAHAQTSLGTDPIRTYLTGHSMGGHGTWHLGVTFPDRWAAIAPSAGWVSMWSYAGALRRDTLDGPAEVLTRAASPSDTIGLVENLGRNGVYVLHGDRDDNVPVSQARTMRAELGRFHPDFAYFEQPGAGHWWGNQCVDWPPLFDFFQERSNPKAGDVLRVDFSTASPGVSSRCDWVAVELQNQPFALSRVTIDHDPEARSFRGTTQNVARLAIDLTHLEPGAPIAFELDGDAVETPWPDDGTTIRLARSDDSEGWAVVPEPDATAKGPHRYGSFKDAFRHRVVLVYGTVGSEEENAWALARARYDAETFGYRGNGSIDVIPDVAFDPAADADRNVVLYGHAESNAAWSSLLGDGPVIVKRGRLRVGSVDREQDDLACLFIRPRPGSNQASVGVVSGTGLAGLRLSDRLPVFVSGVAYPDLTVLGPEVLAEGLEAVEAAGFFGPDWGVDSGEIVWRDETP
ncbi:carboxylesterase family protein [Tautonia marina]|uniref:carboxylesterase family protein n=1 Tax=Tautonia marina TaxID=2653855 RepID=UPI001260AD43|nr:prolyl oligopeptidase family serine peptidase [Tautonia marina]